MNIFYFTSILLLVFISSLSTVNGSRYITRNWQYGMYTTTTEAPITTPSDSRIPGFGKPDTEDGSSSQNSQGQSKQYLVVDPLTNRIVARITQADLISILFDNSRPQTMKMPGKTNDNESNDNSRNQGSRYMKDSNGNAVAPAINNIYITFHGISGYGMPQVQTDPGSLENRNGICTYAPWLSKHCKNLDLTPTNVLTDNSNLPSTHRIPLYNNGLNDENPSAKTTSNGNTEEKTSTQVPAKTLLTGDIEWVKFPDADVAPSVSQRRSKPKKLDAAIDIRK